jgi:hypothetical protein
MKRQSLGRGLILLVLSGPAGALGDGAPVHWKERRIDPAALPEELPAAARAAVEAWHPWASAHAYRLDLDASGRLLLVARGSNDRAPALVELALQVLTRFDQELPAPALRKQAADPLLAARPAEPPKPKPAGGEKPLPEDPEDPEGSHPWKLPPPKPAPVTSAPVVVTKWGSQGQPLDTQTMTLFIATDQDDFESLLKELAARFAYLEVWAREAQALQGFVLGDPLCAAYLERPDGVEEWDPDHELVNRLARLCLLRRFGELPNWFVQGYAWHMEIALKGAIYCFPWRDEFVWATEHSGWHQEVEARYSKERLEARHFMGWRRGKYLAPEAKASWGTCEYLLAKEGAKLPALLDELRVFREEHGRIQDDPTSWRRNLDYEMPVADQHRLFVQALGPEYLERATIFFRQELDR